MRFHRSAQSVTSSNADGVTALSNDCELTSSIRMISVIPPRGGRRVWQGKQAVRATTSRRRNRADAEHNTDGASERARTAFCHIHTTSLYSRDPHLRADLHIMMPHSSEALRSAQGGTLDEVNVTLAEQQCLNTDAASTPMIYRARGTWCRHGAAVRVRWRAPAPPRTVGGPPAGQPAAGANGPQAQSSRPPTRAAASLAPRRTRRRHPVLAYSRG